MTDVFRAGVLPLPPGVADSPTARLMVFPHGTPPSNDVRNWLFSTADLTKVVDAFARRTEPLPIMYAHGKDPAKGLRAAGWVDKLELEADGLYALVRWTETARTEIRSGDWGFRSPGFKGYKDPSGFVHAEELEEISILNDPAIGGMAPIAARKQEENTVEITAKKNAAATSFDTAGILETLRAAFKLPEAVTDEMLKKMACDALEAGGPEDTPPEDKPGEPPMPAEATPPETPLPFPAAQAARILPVETEEDVKAELARSTRVIAAIRKAAGLKRVTPTTLEAAGRLAWADVEAFETIFCAPVQPPVGRVVQITASDRGGKPLTFADQVREERFAAMRERAKG